MLGKYNQKNAIKLERRNANVYANQQLLMAFNTDPVNESSKSKFCIRLWTN